MVRQLSVSGFHTGRHQHFALRPPLARPTSPITTPAFARSALKTPTRSRYGIAPLTPGPPVESLGACPAPRRPAGSHLLAGIQTASLGLPMRPWMGPRPPSPWHPRQCWPGLCGIGGTRPPPVWNAVDYVKHMPRLTPRPPYPVWKSAPTFPGPPPRPPRPLFPRARAPLSQARIGQQEQRFTPIRLKRVYSYPRPVHFRPPRRVFSAALRHVQRRIAPAHGGSITPRQAGKQAASGRAGEGGRDCKCKAAKWAAAGHTETPSQTAFPKPSNGGPSAILSEPYRNQGFVRGQA